MGTTRARTHKIGTACIRQLMSASPPRAAEKRTCREVRVGPVPDKVLAIQTRLVPARLGHDPLFRRPAPGQIARAQPPVELGARSEFDASSVPVQSWKQLIALFPAGNKPAGQDIVRLPLVRHHLMGISKARP